MAHTVQPSEITCRSVPRLRYLDEGRMPGPTVPLQDSRLTSPERSSRRRRLIALLSSCGLGCAGLVGLFQPLPALAIPQQEAMKKLAVIPVFVLTDSKGIPCPCNGTRPWYCLCSLIGAKPSRNWPPFSRPTPPSRLGCCPCP